MKNKSIVLVFVMIAVLFLGGCIKDKLDPLKNLEPDFTTDEMVEEMLREIEHPELMELNGEEVEYFYEVDVNQLEEYTVRVPLMNINTNEISILKVKNTDDVSTVVKSIHKRAEDVQKMFQKGLPEQYEAAKDYIIETKGKYILFAISEDADMLVEIYEQFFE